MDGTGTRRGDTAGALDALSARFGDRMATGRGVRDQHAHTTTWIPPMPPDAVVWPETTDEVAFAVRTCAEHGVPVVPYGVGTSLEGQVNAAEGGVCLNFQRMAKVRAVHAEDLDCVVEPGITRTALNAHLRDTGLFFPIDPGADATLGGMAATRASGTNAVRYGTMKDVVLALEVVRADGSVIRTGSRAKKSSAGYDLTRLMVGSEGTLGVITELTLRLSAIPEAMSSARVSFPDVGAACRAAMGAIQMALPVARMELMDALMVRQVNAHSGIGLPETPVLLMEFHGSAASVAEQAETFAEIAADAGGTGLDWTTSPEERTRLWQARHDAYWAMMAARPGASNVTTDVCVPISALADAVTAAAAMADELRLIAPIVGHVGDGNFHCGVLLDLDDADEVTRAKQFVSWLAEMALSHGGTCTGEHGVGQGKAGYLPAEHGAALGSMIAIKRALDPAGILNPGKIFLP